jgi:glycosyltransferase involved in cell wall biosynthesis
MGAGMAVVAVADPICDHLLDGETALICESPTARGISTALARLLTDHDFARRLAEGGLAHVRTNHAMSKMAQEVAAVYRKLAIKRTTFPIAE